jgi:uncharacterized membrane protein (UPF0127 family)
MRSCIVRAILLAALSLTVTGCDPPGADEPGRLSKLRTVTCDIAGQPFRLWVAEKNNDRLSGLMYIDASELAPLPDGTRRGMIFVFDSQRSANDGFWMRNVSIPLDIAFLRRDGYVVTIKSMAPFDHRSTYSDGPYWLAIETNAGTFKRVGLKEGDTIQIPDSVLNNTD